MTNKELLQGVGYVDDALLDEALNAPKRRPAVRWGAIAACAGLAVLLGAGVLYGLSTRQTGVETCYAAPDAEADTKWSELSGMEQMAVPNPDPAESTLLPEQPTAPTPEIASENAPAAETPAVPPQTNPPVTEESAHEPPDPDTADTAMLPDQPITEDPKPTAPAVTPMVSDYEGMYETVCYAAPLNGTVGFSLPLWDAMDAYGDTVRYRVVIDVFQNENVLDPDGEEVRNQMNRLVALGYIVAWETVYQDEQPTATYFTIHATLWELEHFPSEDDYGYFLMLYNERVPDQSGANGLVTVYNGMTQSTDALTPFAPEPPAPATEPQEP